MGAFITIYLGCVVSYYITCFSLMGYDLIREYCEKRNKKRREYEALSHRSSPDIEMMSEREFEAKTQNHIISRPYRSALAPIQEETITY
tara:strand:+ start:99 stop:365 length:267 start_codon:yes stop_codon:yes gene_type:complete